MTVPLSASRMLSSGTPDSMGDLAVGDQVAGLAVHRHGVERLEDVVAVQQLAGGGVAGDVDLGVALVDDVGAELEQAVDDAEDGVLVARDQAGRQDDGVALADTTRWSPLAMRDRAAMGSPWEPVDISTTRLSGRLSTFLMSTRMPAGHVQVAELGGDGHVADHGAAHEGDVAAVVGGGVEHLLDAVDVRGEGGHDDALAGLAEEPVQGGADFLLRGGEAGDVGVGGVGHEQVHAFLAQAGEVRAGR